ncbi:ATP-dependent DNA helicase [Frankliniella fusca]|uniref:ATP-dependent DNA helicase n=1 Tax=Frankliniella fusca TaxID=407009 RepID=A0AAE1LXM7_9NEOP|nr:ATP-dependent DNA helicase [Frankliniella fusca]
MGSPIIFWLGWPGLAGLAGLAGIERISLPTGKASHKRLSKNFFVENLESARGASCRGHLNWSLRKFAQEHKLGNPIERELFPRTVG